MGLDTSHDCWHGPYSAFNRWRDKLAEVAGYTGHSSANPINPTTIDIDWGNVEEKIGRDLFGKWDKIPVRPDGTPDALIILIAHSDCDGELQWEFCDALADRLEELIPALDGDDYMVNKTVQFVIGLREAHENEENVIFA